MGTCKELLGRRLSQKLVRTDRNLVDSESQREHLILQNFEVPCTALRESSTGEALRATQKWHK